MDDGFQNFDLAKDLSFLVFDGGAGLGNGKLLPAGPLREPLAHALKRADALVVVGDAPSPRLSQALNGRPFLRAELKLAEALPEGPLIAFAGIGRPQKFFDALRAAGAALAESVPFPDHHTYTSADLAFLGRLARERAALLVTTEKDHVRLPAALRDEIHPVPAEMRVHDLAALDALIDRIL
jgi:tetraacyldisaccharide 4'-kinase